MFSICVYRLPNTVARSFLCMPRTLFGNNPGWVPYRLQVPRFPWLAWLYLPFQIYSLFTFSHSPKQFSGCTVNACVASLCLFPQLRNGQRAEKLILCENWESWCAWMCFEPHLMDWAATLGDIGLFLPQTIRLLIHSTNNDHMVLDRCLVECWESTALNWQNSHAFWRLLSMDVGKRR